MFVHVMHSAHSTGFSTVHIFISLCRLTKRPFKKKKGVIWFYVCTYVCIYLANGCFILHVKNNITEHHVTSDNYAWVITNSEQSTCIKAVETNVTSDNYDIATDTNNEQFTRIKPVAPHVTSEFQPRVQINTTWSITRPLVQPKTNTIMHACSTWHKIIIYSDELM